MSDSLPERITALKASAKLRLRISTDALDEEVIGIVQAAIADMELRGIDVATLLPLTATAASDMNALAVRAVMLYCKANFGIAGSDTERAQYAACYENTTQSMSLCTGYLLAPPVETDEGV